MDKEHEKQNEVLEEDNKNIRREPLYAKVKKEKKVISIISYNDGLFQ